MPREHGKDGAFVETVTLDDVLDTFDHVDGPVILSADVADRLECSRETARRKLEELYDRGDLARRKVSRRVIYWRPDEATGFDSRDLQGDPETTLADTEAMKQSDRFSKPNMRTYRYVGDNTPDDSDGDIYDPTEEFQ